MSVKPWHLLDPRNPYTSQEEYTNRLSVCKSCPDFNKMFKTCNNCGCFMLAKAALKGATCPIDKWKK